MFTFPRPSAQRALVLLCAALVAGPWGCRTASEPCPVTTLAVTPNPLTIVANTTRSFTATGRDYKGNALTSPSSWSVLAGGGAIDANSGAFTAGAVLGTYPNTIQAANGGLTATATVIVIDNSSPATLGSAGTFAILAGSTVTNVAGTTTTIEGDVGVWPGGAITGLPAGQPSPGTIHAADGVAAAAQGDLTTAYVDLDGRVCGTNLTSLDLGGMTLAPGVYCFDTSAGLTGTVTFDGNGDPNAVFVIQIGSTLTTASGSAVDLIDSAQAENVYWLVRSSATLGTGTSFQGNIVALESITLTTGASLNGRALARNAAVTLDTNAVTLP